MKKLILALVIIAVIALSPQAMLAFFGNRYIIATDTIRTHPGHVLFYITLGNNEDTYLRQDGGGPVGFLNDSGNFVVDFADHIFETDPLYNIGTIYNKSDSEIVVNFDVSNFPQIIINDIEINANTSSNIVATLHCIESGYFSGTVSLSVFVNDEPVVNYDFPIAISVQYPMWDQSVTYSIGDIVFHQGVFYLAKTNATQINRWRPGTHSNFWEPITVE